MPLPLSNRSARAACVANYAGRPVATCVGGGRFAFAAHWAWHGAWDVMCSACLSLGQTPSPPLLYLPALLPISLSSTTSLHACCCWLPSSPLRAVRTSFVFLAAHLFGACTAPGAAVFSATSPCGRAVDSSPSPRLLALLSSLLRASRGNGALRRMHGGSAAGVGCAAFSLCYQTHHHASLRPSGDNVRGGSGVHACGAGCVLRSDAASIKP